MAERSRLHEAFEKSAGQAESNQSCQNKGRNIHAGKTKNGGKYAYHFSALDDINF